MSQLKIGFMESPAPWLCRQEAQTALGLLYLATVVKEAGYKVQMYKPKRQEDLMEIAYCDIVCMGGTTLEYPMNVECALALKNLNPNIKIFTGGAHVTAMGGDVANIFDRVCIGEGEKDILLMIKDFENKDESAYLYVADDDIDINDIPIPDRELIVGSHGGNIFINHENYQGHGNENFITSRGCHFSCAFCSSKSIFGGSVRYRNADNIETELRAIADSTVVRQLRICDDNFTSNRTRLKTICELLKKYGFVWRCSARAESLSKETCEILKEGGCKEVSVGIESGDQRVLDFMNKKTNTGKMMEGCANAKEAGIKVRALFMIGTPGETLDTPEVNKRYIDRLDFDLITLSTFIPLPGTDIWNSPEKYNCEIVSTDFTKYNKDYYQAGEVRKYNPLIRNQSLTLEEQIGNVKRMEYYVEKHQVNKG